MYFNYSIFWNKKWWYSKEPIDFCTSRTKLDRSTEFFLSRRHLVRPRASGSERLSTLPTSPYKNISPNSPEPINMRTRWRHKVPHNKWHRQKICDDAMTLVLNNPVQFHYTRPKSSMFSTFLFGYCLGMVLGTSFPPHSSNTSSYKGVTTLSVEMMFPRSPHPIQYPRFPLFFLWSNHVHVFLR